MNNIMAYFIFVIFVRNCKAVLIDGAAIAKKIKDEIRQEVKNIVSDGGRPPHMAVILVGNDPASIIYVKHKRKAAEYTGEKLFCLLPKHFCVKK